MALETKLFETLNGLTLREHKKYQTMAVLQTLGMKTYSAVDDVRSLSTRNRCQYVTRGIGRIG